METSQVVYYGTSQLSNIGVVYFRDNNKPINVLTGIDYWLDNLICNVPELVMCFHVNGIVQVSKIQCGFSNLLSAKECREDLTKFPEALKS